MNTEEKITVIQASNLWLKPPRIYLLILGIVVILIPILIYLYTQSQQVPIEPKPSIVPTPTSTPAPTPQLPSLETEGKLNKLEGKQLILEKKDGNKETFTLTDSTIFYKCSDFSDINSCIKTQEGITTASLIMIISKGPTAVFVLYK